MPRTGRKYKCPARGEKGAIMAEEGQQTTTATTSEPPVDWKAKYEESVQHSRTWEERSKANYARVGELEEKLAAYENAKPDGRLEAATKRADEAEAKLASYEHEAQVADWRKAAASKYGVPSDLLSGETEEAIGESAEKLADYLKSRPAAPRFTNPAGVPKTSSSAHSREAEAIRTALFGQRR